MKFIALIFCITSFVVHARELPRLKRLGNNKVIYQSTKVLEVKSRGLFKTRVVVKWGEHVFEVADAYFKCSSSRCSFESSKSRDFFESCRLKETRMSCSKRLTPQEGGSPDRGGYWERNAEGEYTRRVDQGDEEYPSRSDESWESGGIVLF